MRSPRIKSTQNRNASVPAWSTPSKNESRVMEAQVRDALRNAIRVPPVLIELVLQYTRPAFCDRCWLEQIQMHLVMQRAKDTATFSLCDASMQFRAVFPPNDHIGMQVIITEKRLPRASSSFHLSRHPNEGCTVCGCAGFIVILVGERSLVLCRNCWRHPENLHWLGSECTTHLPVSHTGATERWIGCRRVLCETGACSCFT